jgi:hypothetical protein
MEKAVREQKRSKPRRSPGEGQGDERGESPKGGGRAKYRRKEPGEAKGGAERKPRRVVVRKQKD